jgi:hypothetical protein
MKFWIGLVMLLIGMGIMIGCAVPMSKTDKTTKKYKGLIAGVVIGVLMTVAGLGVMIFGQTSSISPVSTNPIVAMANKLEMSGMTEAENATKKLEAARQLNKVAGMIKA